MMQETSRDRDTLKRGARISAASKINASRSVSELALGRSLGLRVVPGLFLGCIAIAIPENQVGAVESLRGAPHVRVSLQVREVATEPVSAIRSVFAKAPRSWRGEASEISQKISFEVISAPVIAFPVGDDDFQPSNGRAGGTHNEVSHEGPHKGAGAAFSYRPAGGEHSTLNAAGSWSMPMLPTPDLADVDKRATFWPHFSFPKGFAGSAVGLMQQLKPGSMSALAHTPVVFDRSLDEDEVTFGNRKHSGVENPAGPPHAARFRTAFFLPKVSKARDTGSDRKGEVLPLRSTLPRPDLDLLRSEDPALLPPRNDADAFSTMASDLATGTTTPVGDSAIEPSVMKIAPTGGPWEIGLTADIGTSRVGAEAYAGGAATELGTISAAGVTNSSAPLPDGELNASPAATDPASQMVPLRTMVELLSEHFAPDELEWFRRSPAIDTTVPVSAFDDAELGLALAQVGDAATAGLAGMQAAPAIAGGGSFKSGRSSGFARSLVLTASAGFDSNPFLGNMDDASAASIRLQLVPTISRSTERNTFRLSGRAEHIEYLANYRSLQNYGVDLATSHKATQRLEIDAGLLFSSNVLATNVANPFLVDDLSTGVPLPPTGNDITILGQGQRRMQFGANAGFTYILTERDQLRWALTGRADRFKEAGLTESNFLAQQLQYSRQLDEELSIGAVIDANLIDFVGSTGDKARTISPQLQVRAALTPRIEVTGSVGIAITQREFGGLEETTTAFAGNLSLCNRLDRSNFCITGSRQVLPAAIGGALLQTTAGISYSLRISERDTLQLSGNYARASQPVTNVVGPSDFESINGFVRYERQLDERLRLFVSTGYLNTSGNLPAEATNFQALIGITFNLGQTR